MASDVDEVIARFILTRYDDGRLPADLDERRGYVAGAIAGLLELPDNRRTRRSTLQAADRYLVAFDAWRAAR